MKLPNPKKENMKIYYFKKTTLLIALVFASSFSFAQLNYTWMKGSSAVDQPGTYGTIGVAGANNNPGGREQPVSWKDNSGNFWLFGGLGLDIAGNPGFLNDLWKYSPTTNQWTWVKGSSTADIDGVYGSVGVASGLNSPGGRFGSASWVDASGNLWLFGGIAWDISSNIAEINDLWMYNIATNQWTWMKGSNMVNQGGTYGTQGTAANNNNPGARSSPGSWADASGNLWLFGGFGNDGSLNYGNLNDLWKYNISANQWTWMKGNNGIDLNGTYGVQGTSAAANNPGSRYLSNTWKDASGNLWLFGGDGFDASTGSVDLLNDLWRYDPVNNQWTWIKGSNASGQPGTYGTIGVSAIANAPGGRASALSWTDAASNFYLLGGDAYDSQGNNELTDDLWKYTASNNQWSWMKGNNVATPGATYGTQGLAAAANAPGGRYGSVAWIDGSNSLWLFGGFGYKDANDVGNLNDLWKLGGCSAGTLSVTSTNTNICRGSAAVLIATGANTYSWSTSPVNTSTLVVTPTITTIYTVTATDANACIYTASIVQNVSICTGIENNTISQDKYNVYPNPNNGSFTLFMPEVDQTTIIVFNTMGQKVFEQALTSSQSEVQTQLANGLYHYSIFQANKKINSGKLLIE